MGLTERWRLGWLVSLVALGGCGGGGGPADATTDGPVAPQDVLGDTTAPDADAADAASGDAATDAPPDATGDAATVAPSDAGTDAPSDAGTDAPSDAASPDAGCVVIANTGTDVTPARVAAAVPAATGGTIRDGVYYLTASTEYTGAGGASGPDTSTAVRATLEIAGAVWRENSSLTFTAEGNVLTGSYTLGFATTGSAITRTRVCRAGTLMPIVAAGQTYSASRTELLFQPNPGQVITYTWQRP